MTDTTATTVTPDPRVIARAVLLEMADESDQVGDFVTANDLEDHVTDFRFAANIRGYEGWQWSVTLYHDEELDSWTVNESSLIPTEDALLPPKWIPWKDRLEPTDLSPTDSIGTDPDDERIEDGEVAESSLQDVNDAVEEFRLTRRHVLTSLGRAQAAKRWYEGPRGPKALSTKTAEGNLCSTCGFFVPLAGELDRMFGVCANKWSPDDGRVVSLDHGCGEHSEIEPPEPSRLWVQAKPAFDDLHIDVVANKPRKQDVDDAADDDAEEGEPEQVPATDVQAASGEPDDLVTNGGDIDDADDIDADVATEEDILENTEVDDGDADEDDDETGEPDESETAEEVAPGLEAVVDLIEKLRQAKVEEESDSETEAESDDEAPEPGEEDSTADAEDVAVGDDGVAVEDSASDDVASVDVAGRSPEAADTDGDDTQDPASDE